MAQEPMERFEEELKAWADRPPETSAADAAGQVLSRLAERESSTAFRGRSYRVWHWANALAAMLLAVVITTRFTPTLEVAQPVGQSEARVEATPVPEGVVVMWLDAETPLYLTMNQPESL